jgi:hypothetical protein
MPDTWWLLIAIGALVALGILLWGPARAAAREARLAQAKKDFHKQRERLEAKVIRLAERRTDAPHWATCEFKDAVAYVRHRLTRELSAFVEVNVLVAPFDGLPGGGGALASDCFHTGTAIFRFDGKHWETDGRVIFDLSPAEAIRSYQNDFEIVAQELAEQSEP